MTTKYWNQLQEWLKDNKEPISGYISLYPKYGYAYIQNAIESKNPIDKKFKDVIDIYVFPVTLNFNKEGLKCIARKVDAGQTQRVNVPYKHIKKIKINGFNL